MLQNVGLLSQLNTQTYTSDFPIGLTTPKAKANTLSAQLQNATVSFKPHKTKLSSPASPYQFHFSVEENKVVFQWQHLHSLLVFSLNP